MGGLDAGMGLEEFGEGLRIAVLPLDAECERLEAADQEIGGERVDDRAHDPLQPAHRVHELARAEHGAREQVVVAAEVLRRRVHDQIDAPLERPHVVGRGERGVDHRLHAVPAPDRREPLEVQHAVVGVRRRLAEQHARRGTDGVLQRVVVAGRHGGDLDPVALQRLIEELTRPSIGVVGGDDVRATREHREQRRRHGGHAARKEQAVAGALERRQLGFGDLLRRVAVAAVLDALDLAVEVVLQLLCVRERERRRLHDRRGERVRRLRAWLPAVDGQRAWAQPFLGRLHYSTWGAPKWPPRLFKRGGNAPSDSPASARRAPGNPWRSSIMRVVIITTTPAA